ncbi:unnamed protein product [Rhodiola kirilowii]
MLGLMATCLQNMHLRTLFCQVWMFYSYGGFVAGDFEWAKEYWILIKLIPLVLLDMYGTYGTTTKAW